MPLDADALVTLAEAKAQLKREEGNNADDDFIEQLINRASDYAEDYCGRKFTQQTITDKLFDGSGVENLFLVPWPVISITSLFIDTGRTFPASTALVEWNPSTGIGQYLLDKEIGEVSLLDDTFPRLRGVIKATYTAGYTVVPGPIKQAVLLLVDKWFDEREQSAAGQVEAETIGSYSVKYATTTGGSARDPVLDKVHAILDPYYCPNIAEVDRPSKVFTA